MASELLLIVGLSKYTQTAIGVCFSTRSGKSISPMGSFLIMSLTVNDYLSVVCPD